MLHRAGFVLVSLALAACGPGTPPPAPAPQAPPASVPTPPPAPKPDSTHPSREGGEGPRPYREVVPPQASTDSGIFVLHRLNDRLLFEIPDASLDVPFLLVERYEAAQYGTRAGGEALESRVVRWQRLGNHVLLRNLDWEIVADSSEPVARAVRLTHFEPVLMSFDIAAFAPADSAPVIDVTKLYTTDVPEFTARRALKAKRLDSSRSFIERARTFPTNVEISALQTFESDSVPGSDRGLATISLLMHYSMVALPRVPMRPRRCDNRVGFFAIRQEDYGTDEHRVAIDCFIARWRLEPKDSTAAVSDPVRPIVFYIDPATPAQWVPWLIRGVEAWEPVFRAAGFSHAITARLAPTPAEDPKFDLDDARYSAIRWLPTTAENAYGPHISDPRTGEILQSSIGVFHNVMNLVRDWYVVQVGPLDPRAMHLPLPDSLMGALLTYVISHEVGHALGFPHNFKASAAYSVDSLRSASFTARYGDEASIMDYGRFNYVAQPGDGARLIPLIGPYDYFALRWGYGRIPGARTPDEERPALDSLARAQDRDPMLRFGNADGVDPEAQAEDLGSDPVAATTYGLANLHREMPLLLAAATANRLEDYSDLAELYQQLVLQWQRELGHVVTLVGGVYRAERYPSQPGPVFTPVPRDVQRRAVSFLLAQAFVTPTFLLDSAILRRIEQSGTVERVGETQGALLEALFADPRLSRLVDQAGQAGPGAPAYGLDELLADVGAGLFAELARGAAPDVYRRNLERRFVDLLGEKLAPPPPPPPPPPMPPPGWAPPPSRPDEAEPLVRGELATLDALLAGALPHAPDRTTRLHIEDLRFRIDRLLHPRP